MKKIVLYIAVILLAVACNDKQGEAYNAKVMEYDAETSRKSFAAGKRMKSESIRNDKVTVERKLIKTGNITFETKELEETRKTILDLVKQQMRVMLPVIINTSLMIELVQQFLLEFQQKNLILF
jgi:hypothetical protein